MNNSALIFSFEKKNFYSITPLVASIDQNEKLDGFDIFLESDVDSKKIQSYLERYDKVIFAFSFRTAQLEKIYSSMDDLYSNLKTQDLNKIIFVAGGSHPTGDPLSTLRLGFDYAFIGEGELSFSLFLEKWLNNDKLETTPGIAYLAEDKEKLIVNPSPPQIKLDDYPMISRQRKLFPPLEITRGCSFGCAFCQVPSIFNKKTRHRSPDVILETVQWMAKHKLDDIRFITPNSFGYLSQKPKETNEEEIIDLLTKIKNTDGIKRVFFGTFPGEVRPETVTQSIMTKLKKIVSNKKIAIGLQSGSDKILRMYHRGHSVEEGLRAIKYIRDAGFIPIVDFIFGLPDATEADEFQSIEVIKSLSKIGSKIRAHVFMPLPGSKLANAPVGKTSKKIRKELGKLSKQGVIEGNWTHQEKYAEETWKIIQKINSLSIIRKRG
ncbi:MAG: TIGR04013 family B12-binding domain/radical SAM domain-containing protein [Candidatus Heimdallarchaeaceae archaeon]